jgi:hypothetical protein
LFESNLFSQGLDLGFNVSVQSDGYNAIAKSSILNVFVTR